MNRDRKSCRQQNIPKRTIKRNEGALRPRMAAALLLVLFEENMEVGSQSQTTEYPATRITPQGGNRARRARRPGSELPASEKRTAGSPICLDTQCPACTQDRLPWLGLKAVETPSTSCESCQALSALFPIAGARAANTAKKKTIATILATTKGRNPSFKFT